MGREVLLMDQAQRILARIGMDRLDVMRARERIEGRPVGVHLVDRFKRMNQVRSKTERSERIWDERGKQ